MLERLKRQHVHRGGGDDAHDAGDGAAIQAANALALEERSAQGEGCSSGTGSLETRFDGVEGLEGETDQAC